MAFLGRVREHSAKNKMEIHNLATIFGPNLLVSPDRSTLAMVQDTPQINAIVNAMIEDYSTIFGVRSNSFSNLSVFFFLNYYLGKRIS